MSDDPVSVFWDDLNEDLQDLRFRRMFIQTSWRIRMTDRLVNGLIAICNFRRRS